MLSIIQDVLHFADVVFAVHDDSGPALVCRKDHNGFITPEFLNASSPQILAAIVCH